jgi:hypothetical protein
MSEVRSCKDCKHAGWAIEKWDRYPDESAKIKEWYCCKDAPERDQAYYKENGKYVKVTHGTECENFEEWREFPKTRSIRGVRKL